MHQLQIKSFSGKSHQTQDFPEDIHVSYELNIQRKILNLKFTIPKDHSPCLSDKRDRLKSRKDELWRKTCFECFILYSNGEYDEWNFDLDGNWQNYHFTSYRSPQPPHATEREVQTIGFLITEDQELILDLPVEREIVAINPCVILEKKGQHEFYAYAHPKSQADFHRSEYYINWKEFDNLQPQIDK